MTKAELRKMTKLEHMVDKADEHKRNLLRKKIELQKHKIAVLKAKIEEMQAKVSAEKAKGMTMVDEYNYFVGVTMPQHAEDLQELRGKQAAEKAKTDILAAAKTANENREAVKDLIAPETAENDQKDDVSASRDTKPVTDAKTPKTAKKETNAGILTPEPSKNGQNKPEKTGRDTQSHNDQKTQKTVQKTAKTDDVDDGTVSAQDWAWMAKQFGITPVEESSKEETTVNNPFFGNYA